MRKHPKNAHEKLESILKKVGGCFGSVFKVLHLEIRCNSSGDKHRSREATAIVGLVLSAKNVGILAARLGTGDPDLA